MGPEWIKVHIDPIKGYGANRRFKVPKKINLRDIPLFSDFSTEDIEKLRKEIQVRFYVKGEQVFRAGDAAKYFYVVCEGKMKIYTFLGNEKEQILYIYSKGDFVGGFNIICDSDYLYTSVAMDEAVVARFSRELFNEILLSNRHLAISIVHKAFERVRWAEALVSRLTFKTAVGKVARLLIDFIPKFGTKEQDGIVLNTKLTHEEMGNFSGVSRETFTRKLHEFEKKNLIRLLPNKRILILDTKELRELSEYI